jgi:outer membrane receptor protein involved in Fe transport
VTVGADNTLGPIEILQLRPHVLDIGPVPGFYAGQAVSGRASRRFGVVPRAATCRLSNREATGRSRGNLGRMTNMQSAFVRARVALVSGASAIAVMSATPTFAQEAQDATEDAGIETIVVTAQRQAESLQDVPIAVSAFSAEALEKQQIENPSDLQLTLPNVTFTKTNFTSSSFTIRGIGDLCVGVSCDQATAIHLNDSPLFATRLFETEFFDLERIEVLRGPQGTLFGRNATSGVVNVVSAKPNLSDFGASGEVEYGNFDSLKAKGMVNLPIGDKLGVRVAGYYLKRDGYTKNVFDDSRVDDRDLYSIRGSLRFEPTENTTIDLIASYFREKDNRARIQKQLCHRDPTGVLGCLPDSLQFETLNANSTFVGTLGSREFLAFQGIPAVFGLNSIYGPDAYANFVQPKDVRTVNTDFTPEYFTSEQQYQAKIEHDFGSISASLSGTYQKVKLESRQDYNLSVQDRSGYVTGLSTLAAAAAGLVPGLPAAYFAPVASALIPSGPGGVLCTSDTVENGTGSFGGQSICAATPLDFDRSNSYTSSWSVEGIISSDFDSPFNFLLGGIYANAHLTENSYYVNAFGIDYITGLLGAFNSFPAALPPSYLGTPFFRNNTDNFRLKSYGIFGEAYYEFSDALKLTLGLRYNNDKKNIRARSTLASFLVPFGTANAFDSPFVVAFDADPGTPGNQLFQERQAKFDEFTGRAVLDWKISDDSLVYASYSRGYKSGGINPPLQPIFAVPESFAPEKIDAFELGAKNTLLDGTLQLNATAFYYKYKGLQLSRIVARTSVNDNVDANIYGLELESVLRPTPAMLLNLNFSYLKTKVASDKFLSNPRDPSGGRNDAVIIKDITNGANCAVTSNTGSATAANTFVGTVNGVINAIGASRPANGGVNPAPLQNPTPFPASSGLGATGAFSICQILQLGAAGGLATLNPAFAGAQAFINTLGGITFHPSGVETNLKGNKLPQAPNFKFSAGFQYTFDFDGGMSLVPRIDLAFTGESTGNIFNGRPDKIDAYTQVNAQIQLNGADDRWFVRGFVQNLFDSDSVTGNYLTDASSGLFTNIFTLEPRRYGIAAGFKF